jgi:hypothetical protein
MKTFVALLFFVVLICLCVAAPLEEENEIIEGKVSFSEGFKCELFEFGNVLGEFERF